MELHFLHFTISSFNSEIQLRRFALAVSATSIWMAKIDQIANVGKKKCFLEHCIIFNSL